jgi:hypothetical protein
VWSARVAAGVDGGSLSTSGLLIEGRPIHVVEGDFRFVGEVCRDDSAVVTCRSTTFVPVGADNPAVGDNAALNK